MIWTTYSYDKFKQNRIPQDKNGNPTVKLNPNGDTVFYAWTTELYVPLKDGE